MKKLAQVFSVIFHPVFVPLTAVIFFFVRVPLYYENDLLYSKVIAILIVMVLIPILFLYFARTIRLISSLELPTAKERRFPLLFFMILDLVVINYIFDLYNFQYLFYFFWSLLLAAMLVFIALFFRFRISLHSMGLSSLLAFLCLLSYHFQLDFRFSIAFLVLCTGLVSSSRLYLKAHRPSEIVLGVVIGVLTQLLIPLVKYYRM